MHYASKLHDLSGYYYINVFVQMHSVYLCISEYICANKTNLWAGSLCMSVMQIIVLHPYTNFEVCRPSRFEDKSQC